VKGPRPTTDAHSAPVAASGRPPFSHHRPTVPLLREGGTEGGSTFSRSRPPVTSVIEIVRSGFPQLARLDVVASLLRSP